MLTVSIHGLLNLGETLLKQSTSRLNLEPLLKSLGGSIVLLLAEQGGTLPRVTLGEVGLEFDGLWEGGKGVRDGGVMAGGG